MTRDHLGRATSPGGEPVVVVGAGLAGLTTALALAPRPCLVLSAGPARQTAASGWAQGGVAAALGADDSPALHAADTLAAGAGLCDPGAVHRITASAPEAVRWLAGLGAAFDRTADGRPALGLEGAHRRHRIVHAGGDASGAEVLRAVEAAVRSTSSVTVREGSRALRVLTAAGVVTGVLVADEHGRHTVTATSQVVLATGGAGGLWPATTNPLTACGQGLALAGRAGAVLRDLEMMQFHPTALDVGRDPMPLVSEAVRGAGATLVRADGRAVVQDPLASRDVVARAVWQLTADGGQVFLDARAVAGGSVAASFPAFAEACAAAGLDPARDLVPVRPAAHYHCGGVLVDRWGRTTVPGLWACGEVASTGLHGANRLASNSLLEAVVGGLAVAEDLARGPDTRSAAWPPGPGTVVPAGATTAPPGTSASRLTAVRQTMGEVAGVLRDGPELARAAADLQARLHSSGADGLDDALLVATMVCTSALARRESRGGHQRMDHPWRAEPALHTTVRLDPAGTGLRVDRVPVRPSGADADTGPASPGWERTPA